MILVSTICSIKVAAVTKPTPAENRSRGAGISIVLSPPKRRRLAPPHCRRPPSMPLMGRTSDLESALGPDRAPCPDRRSQSQHRLGREASCARGRAPASGVLDFPRRPGGRARAAEAPSGEVSFRRPVGEHLLRPPAARRGDDAGG